jgi:hypothetical protein
VRLRGEAPNNDRTLPILIEGLEGGTGFRLIAEYFRFCRLVRISDACFVLVPVFVFSPLRIDVDEDALVIAVKLDTVRGLWRLIGGRRTSRRDLDRLISGGIFSSNSS